MMETFLVLGLCFIIYEALDFFQGCLHSTSPNSTDQIEAYRRQLDEQRQQLQQEQFIANLTPLLGAQLLAATSSVSLTPSESTASIISEQLRAQQQREQLVQQLEGSIRSGSTTSGGAPSNVGDNSLSTPALHSSGLGSTFGSAVGSGSLSVASGNSSGAAFRPAYRSAYESQELYATSSLPRDYYFLQQQQQKNKHSARSLFSKFGASNSDNRIFPETTAVLGVPAGVITQQPAASVNHFECLPPATVPASPLAFDLKRAILSNNNKNRNSNNNKTYNERRRTASAVESVLVHGVAVIASPSRDPPNPIATTTTTVKRANLRNRNANAALTSSGHDSDGSTSDCESDTSVDSSDSSASASAGSASLASCGEDSDPGLGEEREFGLSNSCSSSHADFREIECERLRRKCVSVKRIYSISEKF
ncbi:probable serine/threonine-protein kinase dyrk2 [Zeugodacus cucurbitae]|uniref:probable serine/threonine-protein kinase dyrk2 n=1 Tax=Zeugodacus cucurbitae TaxID=28588 RepID=UPI0023D94EA3|nr:probable serine/threonine-protein kinase dyrk2 [Zeugodacus cucurbitae]